MATPLVAKNAPPEALEWSLYDRSNPISLINMVPERLVPVMERVKAQMPKTVFFAEKDIRRVVKPEERDERLRLNFWDEYNASTMLKKKMSMKSIISSTTGMDTWENYYEPDDYKMLWIFTPPRSYADSMKYILHKGIERLQEIMECEIIDPATKKLDVRAATIILKAFQLVDLRVKGAIVQKIAIQQRNYNLNADVTQEQLAERVENQIGMLTLEELEKLDRKLDRVDKQQHKIIEGLPDDDKQEVLDIESAMDPHKDSPTRIDHTFLPKDDELAD